ncbi:MAG: TauD/TfdA family dioxygenase [Gammaproteobacteria bacterium]|nr:TauD/TfdA family dioxygenase [Gammaproteobacteria bacterium]MCW9031023.1 TauD/TfdA family dioxygenase [Gammaproteobacteria bacterium]
MVKNHSPFSLLPEAEPAYQMWRDWKLSVYPKQSNELLVSIDNPFTLTANEKETIRQCFIRANMAIYSIKYMSDFASKKIVEIIGNEFGLFRLDNNLGADSDNITSLQVIEGGRKQGYIPYSNMKLSWHTDGYYNLAEEQIRGVILHCVNSAVEGGENALLDHEMMYIHLRDRDPAYISALMKPDVLTIPANIENGVNIRDAQTGPVFSIDPNSGALHMRYSARKRNIIWADDKVTAAAVTAIDDFLASDSPWIMRHRLEPGQGLICNNVLHNRTSFNNGDASENQRLIYRGRYYDRLSDTSFNDTAKAIFISSSN